MAGRRVRGRALPAAARCTSWYTSVASGLADAWDLLVRPRVGELLRQHGARCSSAAVALSAVIGVGCALAGRAHGPAAARGCGTACSCAPLAVPAFVNSYGWVSLTHAVQAYAGAVLVVSAVLLPPGLPAGGRARCAASTPGLEEVAFARASAPWTTFCGWSCPAAPGRARRLAARRAARARRVRRAADARFPTFTTAIYDQYRSAFNGPAATVLAGVLVPVCLLLLAVELLLRAAAAARSASGAGHRARVERRAPRPALGCPSPRRPGRRSSRSPSGVPSAAWCAGCCVGSSTAFPVGELARRTARTVGLAVAAALPSRPWPRCRSPGWRSAPRAVCRPRRAQHLHRQRAARHRGGAGPGHGLDPAGPAGLPDRARCCSSATRSCSCPARVVSVRAALEHAPPVLEDVARSLGAAAAGPPAPGHAAADPARPRRGRGAGVPGRRRTELTATLLLAPIGTRTLATEFWSHLVGRVRRRRAVRRRC